MITELNKRNMKELDVAILNALKPIEQEFGVKFKMDGGTFYNLHADVKIRLDVVNRKPGQFNQEEAAYNARYSAHGMPPLFSIIKQGRSEYKIMGWKTRNRKNPILLERVSDGASFRCPPDYVNAAQLVTSG